MIRKNARAAAALAAFVLAACMAFGCSPAGSTSGNEQTNAATGAASAQAASSHLQRDDWADDVKSAVNDFIDQYGKGSASYSPNSYVVSDFDNTASIFDMTEQYAVYQAEVMGYGFTPAELPAILASGLGDMDRDLTSYGYGKGSYNDWISDITAAYTCLWTTYGPFTPAGVDEATQARMQSDPMWAEFTAKVMNLYGLISDVDSIDVSWPWITYLNTGMTDDQVYALSRQSHAKYRQVETGEKTIQTSGDVDSKVGVVGYTYIEGIQVTENTRELWQKLSEAGIDVWVCSASESNVIRAAIDEFGLHEYCTGLLGMTPVEKDGKLTSAYDYETGYAWYATADGGWTKGTVATHAQTAAEGKVVAIQNVAVSKYGCGPLAGFMDSTGDFNFCTEFSSLKLVICFNRADRKVTDGGSLVAEVSQYQKNVLGYTLVTANQAGDTLYVLQGRDENGTRTLRNSNATIRLGKTEERLYRDEKNEAIYQYLVDNKLTTADAFATFAIKTAADSSANRLGFAYGFLANYSGYHSK